MSASMFGIITRESGESKVYLRCTPDGLLSTKPCAAGAHKHSNRMLVLHCDVLDCEPVRDFVCEA